MGHAEKKSSYFLSHQICWFLFIILIFFFQFIIRHRFVAQKRDRWTWSFHLDLRVYRECIFGCVDDCFFILFRDLTVIFPPNDDHVLSGNWQLLKPVYIICMIVRFGIWFFFCLNLRINFSILFHLKIVICGTHFEHKVSDIFHTISVVALQ